MRGGKGEEISDRITVIKVIITFKTYLERELQINKMKQKGATLERKTNGYLNSFNSKSNLKGFKCTQTEGEILFMLKLGNIGFILKVKDRPERKAIL